jgi:hypothetical protein
VQFEGPGALMDYFYGYLSPGRVVGLNSFRVYAAGSVVQAVVFLRDFKLGHYMKIPPRSMFLVQVRFLVRPNTEIAFIGLECFKKSLVSCQNNFLS